jgi:predicted extracellular nuclease
VYKIEPIAVPVVQPADRPPASIQPAGEGEFSVMTWNVENLFDTLDPHPADPPRPKSSEYQVHLSKVATTIVAAGAPSVVALQEVENIGVLESLAAHELLAGYGYQPVLIEGFDSRYIDVGYLVRGDVTILDVQQRDAPEGLTSRPPLVIKLEMPTKNGAATVYLINNHFTSMSGGEEATEPRRNAQAAWNVTLLQEIQAQDPQAMVAILGDLNSYLGSKPIQTLRDGGLAHVFDTLPKEARYTYIYQGESQVLDHILITPALMEWLARVEVLHVNADYPLPMPDDASPTHKSDHDPVVAVFAAP